MFGDKPRSLPQRIALILIPEFTMMPVTSAIEPLRIANRQAEKELYVWTMHSADSLPVAASTGMPSWPTAISMPSPSMRPSGLRRPRCPAPYAINRLHRLAAPGGATRYTTSARCAPAPMSWPKPACSTATAAPSTGKTCRAFGEAFRRSTSPARLFEIDRDRFTSAGGTSALDMMLALIASQHGADLAAAVAESVLHSPIRHHSEHQRMSLPARIGARHPKLVGIIEEMEGNLEEPLSPSMLAKRPAFRRVSSNACSAAISTARPSAITSNCGSRRRARCCSRPTCR